MRVVIDTNVLISGIFWTGKPKQLLNKVRSQEITFVTSEILLDELKEVLARADKPFHLASKDVERVVNAMRDLAEVVRPRSCVAICRHDADNRVLECALDGHAGSVVTGDVHLLELEHYQGIRIMTVADCLGHLQDAIREE